MKAPPISLIATASLVACVALAADQNWSTPAGQDWPANGGGWSNQRYSRLTEINRNTVKTLGGAWMVDLGSEIAKGSPVVQGGVMYVAAGGGHLYAIDAKTGKTIWSMQPPGPGIDPRNRGLAVGDGKVFVGQSDGSVIAVDAKSGQQVWSTYIGDGPARFGMFVSAAPTYVDGLVIAGLASGDAGIRGKVVALDAKTGKQVWQFNTIPGPGEPGHETWPQGSDSWKNGGAGVWMVSAVDPQLGLVYFGTSNAAPQYGGEVRAGENLYTATALALEIKTGKMRWHFQSLHHDIWEGDLGAPLVLFDYKNGNVSKPAIGILRTDGYLFILDRITGAPIIPVEERPVKQNPRLKTAATQPYPVGADKIGPNCVEKDLIPEGFVPSCYWDPIDYDQPNVIAPTSTRFAPMSFDPGTGYFYVAGQSNGHWIRRGDDPYFFTLPTVPGMKSYGLLAAIDSRTDKIVWQKHMTYPIAFGSGTTATAGGLIFHGDPDGTFQAYDDKTGDKLWQFQTGGDVSAPSIIYAVDGEEYVAAIASNRVWGFKLGGKLAELPAPPAPKTVTDFAGRIVKTDKVQMAGEEESIGVIKPAKFFDEYILQPTRIKVKVGAKVTWTNAGKVAHDATAADGSWSTGEIAPGGSASVTFDKAGTYTYRCKDHPWSLGQVIVE
jgi:alcohol dehydrogenase (cytochrome c)